MLLEKQGRSSQRQRMQDGGGAGHHHVGAAGAATASGDIATRRAGSLPPSSLPRPPRSLKSTNSRYCRLSDSETRKKSDPGLEPQLKANTRDSGNCTLEYGRFDGAKVLRRKKSSECIMGGTQKKVNEYERLGGSEKSNSLEIKHRDSQARSLIPPPSRRMMAEYGRLSDGGASATDAKQQPRKSHESSASSSRGQSTGSIMSTKSEASTGSLHHPIVVVHQPSSSPTATTMMLKPGNRSIPRPSNYRIQF